MTRTTLKFYFPQFLSGQAEIWFEDRFLELWFQISAERLIKRQVLSFDSGEVLSQ